MLTRLRIRPYRIHLCRQHTRLIACAHARVIARAPALSGSRWHCGHAEDCVRSQGVWPDWQGLPSRASALLVPARARAAVVVGPRRERAVPRVLVLVGGPQPSANPGTTSLLVQKALTARLQATSCPSLPLVTTRPYDA
jgi:hypothetical protein